MVGATFWARQLTGMGAERCRLRNQVAVREIDAAIGERADAGGVGHHQDSAAISVQVTKQIEHDFFVCFIEIAGRFVSQDQFRVIDQRPRDGYALLFAARQLRGQMFDAIAKADAVQGLPCFAFVRCAVKVLSQHHVFQRRKIRNEMELLKYEANFFSAEPGQAILIKPADVNAVDQGPTAGGGIEPAENVNQSGFARTRRAHDRDPFALLNFERNAVERTHFTEFFAQVFDLYDAGH